MHQLDLFEKRGNPMIIDDATLDMLAAHLPEGSVDEAAARLLVAYRRLRDVFVALGIEVE